MPDFPAKLVDIYWGGGWGVIKITSRPVLMNRVVPTTLQWMKENPHWFHTENICYWRYWERETSQSLTMAPTLTSFMLLGI